MPPHPHRRQTFGLGLGAGLAALAPGSASAAPTDKPEPSFTLLLVNDIYQMSEIDGRGGFARLAAIVKAERERGVPLLYCHAGDSLSPSLMSGLDRGAHIVELLNVAPPDVFVPGNHEFDFGPEVFRARMAEARFPVYAANLRDGAGQPLPGLRDRALHQLGNVRVGIVGITLETTPLKAQTGDLRFGPEIETLSREADALRKEGADLVVGVAHTARATDEAIVRAGLVDILLSGHDHDLVLRYDRGIVMAESGQDAHHVVAIDVTASVNEEGRFRRVTWRPSFRIHDSAQVVPDPEALAIVRRLEGEMTRELDAAVGVAATPLDSRAESVRVREASFGTLVADAVRTTTGAEIGLMNGGGLRGNRLYPAGSVLTRRDFLTELPFGNTTVLVEIDGAALRAAVENGYLDLGRPAGRFLHVSGLVVILDPAAPPGRRAVAITVGGQALEDGRRYTVAANDFMLEGGNGYGMLASGRILIGPTDGRLLAQEVMTYLQARSPLVVEAEGRIRIR